MKPDLVTVYIPTRNRLNLLKRAVDSVYHQTYPWVELIVVDDGSNDGTAEYLSKLNSAGRLRYLRNEHSLGAPASRNRAILEASGQFITGLDDDDELEPSHLTSLVSRFDPVRYSAIAAGILEAGQFGRVRHIYGAGIVTRDKILHHNIIGNQMLTLTERLRDLGGFDELLPAMQDYELWIRLVHKFGPALKVRECTYIWHTDHDSCRISNDSQKRVSAVEYVLRKHRALMSRSHLDSFELHRTKVSGEPFPFFKAVSLANRNNIIPVALLYLSKNVNILSKILFRVRSFLRV